ncbi:MAG: DinB family protein [Bernardetiaceae bacterium]|jgi:uncharacterized damage-inducible protein DinB|nr:DinB family protein [Bernardetiaceae bacterium]
MEKLPIVQATANRLLNQVYKSLDKVILAVPEGQLGFRATEANMSFGQIALHVYQAALVFTRSIVTGQVDFADKALIPLEAEQVCTPAQVVAYAQQVQNFMRQTLATLTEADVTRPIKAPFGELNGLRVCNVMLEEAIHHRGQLTIYLRLLGVAPPSIYDHR